jgi:hypothetical protein
MVEKKSELTAKGFLTDFVRPLQTIWAVIVAELDAVRGAPIIMLPLAVCAVLMSMEQGADLTVTAGSDTCKASWLVLATAFYSFQCWFWARLVVTEWRDPREHPHLPPWALKLSEWLRDWTPRLLGAAPFFIAFMAAWKAKVDLDLLPYIFAGLGVIAPFVYRLRRPVAAHFDLRNGDLFRRVSQLGTLILGLTSLVVLCLWPVGPAQFLGAIGVVFLGLAFITAALAWGLHRSRTWRLPVLAVALLLVVFVFSGSNDNHAIGRRTLHREDEAGAMRLTGAKPTLEAQFDAWCGVQGGCSTVEKNPTPIVFVAAEGGASRAGYWAADVLGKLQFDTRNEARPFSDRVFAISSVSGGSVGVMAYVSALSDTPDLKGAPFANRLADVAGVDYLSPAIAGLLFSDLAQGFWPRPLPFLPDRAETLETGFESGWRQACLASRDGRPEASRCDENLWARPFLSLWRSTDPTKTKPWRPVVLINGTRQEDGRRIITSNVDVTSTTFPNAVDFHKLAGRDVRISTAIHNGARFPVVSPGGTLIDSEGKSQGHLLDGGYFDGGGVVTMADTAAAVLRIARHKHYKLKPIFIELNNNNDADDTAASLIRAGDTSDCVAQSDATKTFVGKDKPRETCRPADSLQKAKPRTFLADLLGPVDGLASVRDAHGTAAGMALAQAVEDSKAQAAEKRLAEEAGKPANADESKLVLGEWGVWPTYRLVHLCMTDVKMPMDWALSKGAKRRTDEILNIQSVAGALREGAQNVKEDDIARQTCLVPHRLNAILADLGTSPVSGVLTRRGPPEDTDGGLWRRLRWAAVATVLGALVNIWADYRLNTAGLPTTAGLQRCRTRSDFEEAVGKWPRVARSYIWTAFSGDVLCLIGYAGVGAILAQLLIDHQPVHEGGRAVFALLTPMFRISAGLVVAAAFADAVEDFVQIGMVRKGVSDGATRAARAATMLKWLMLALGIALMLGAAVFGCERGG